MPCQAAGRHEATGRARQFDVGDIAVIILDLVAAVGTSSLCRRYFGNLDCGTIHAKAIA